MAITSNLAVNNRVQYQGDAWRVSAFIGGQILSIPVKLTTHSAPN